MQTWIDLGYLVASALFIFGLKQMSHPRSAARGNLISAMGMLLAIIVTLVQGGFAWWVIGGGIGAGAVLGMILALRVEMTKMPELVALFNGVGGGATVFVAAVSILDTPYDQMGAMQVAGINTPIVLSGLIGAVTFSGSLIAMGKLLELKIFWNPISLPGHQFINGLLFLGALGLGVGMVAQTAALTPIYWGLVALALALGVMLVLPIGGADMPVVVALLNSYSGLAAAAAGFIVSSTVLIIAGSLVGASGLILCGIMCKAMNRSLTNVLFGKIDAGGVTATADEVYEGRIKRTSADEIAMLFDDARRVVIVPGYGMAVAQAQFAVRDLFKQLEKQGIEVEFAIHPVAGRMPGHMNVLLAEVDIPYEKLKAMEEVNPTFEQADVAIVLGANDVVNPDGRENPESPIAGMPILDVDKARTVVVIKRSLSPGFAGIPNPLFAADNTLMFFSDGKKATLEMVAAVKENAA